METNKLLNELIKINEILEDTSEDEYWRIKRAKSITKLLILELEFKHYNISDIIECKKSDK